MITQDNIKKLLSVLGFSTEDSKIYSKTYEQAGITLSVNIPNEHFHYTEAGITVGRETTSNFSEPENFVVFECIDRLLTIGYKPEHIAIPTSAVDKPEHIELEPAWKLGHTSSNSGEHGVVMESSGINMLMGNCLMAR